MNDNPPIQAFLSYAHADEEEFEFVQPFTSKFAAIVAAKVGRKLNIFVDRAAIGWGEHWRGKISDSVNAAVVFIPIVTANYLESPSCREELIAFHSKADVLGVTDLLLPVLPFTTRLVSEDSSDEVARLVAGLQYESIESELLAGYASPEWLRKMAYLADRLVEAVEKAEDVLLQHGSEGVESSEKSPGDDSDVPSGDESDSPTATVESEDENSPALIELMSDMDSTVKVMAASAEALTPALEELGDAVGGVELGDNPTPKQAQLWALNIARRVSSPAKAIDEHGRDLFTSTKRLDEILAKLDQLAVEMDSADVDFGLRTQLDIVHNSFGDLSEVEQTMTNLLEQMRPGELISVPLRKALRPARHGITNVRDSLRMIRSWRDEAA